MPSLGRIACLILLASCTPRGDAGEAARPAAADPRTDSAAPAAPAAHPCRTQDGQAVTHRLKAVGTEPFWAAEVDGRCVTYRTPEDQSGTRVWTKVEAGAQGAVWNGALRGRQFQLIVRPAAGCSDGMSDRTYPLESVLRVDGETRKGCAEPL